MELFLMQRSQKALSSVQTFTSWYWVSSYLKIEEEVHLWPGIVVAISKLMRYMVC